MCEHCPLLRTVRTTAPALAKPLRQCPACALPMDITQPHTVCPGCLVYALLHQNTFIQRWHDIHDTLRPTPPIQQHQSIHTPNPSSVQGASCHLDGSPIPTMPVPTRHPRHVLDLTIHQHDNNEIAAVLARSTTTNNTQVHISHPHMGPPIPPAPHNANE